MRRQIVVEPSAINGVNGGGSLTVIDIGTTLNQRFLLEKELGRGGMGAVYSATDQVLQRKVAIKVLKEQSGEEVGKKLRLEAQIAARLLHDNVVRIYDFGQAEATYFLVMEEVNGTSYSKRWRHLRWRNGCEFWPRWPRRSTTRTTRAWSTATSSRPTCC